MFDVLRCFVGLNKPDDAEKIVNHLIVDHQDDLRLYRSLVSIMEHGESKVFQAMIENLQLRIDRLDPPESTAEQVFERILKEVSDSSKQE